MPEAGDLIFIHWSVAGKTKYLICIDPDQKLFMVLNTDPWDRHPNGQLQVTPQEIDDLKTVSHINTAQLVRVSELELNVLELAPHRNKGPLTQPVRDRIKEMVNEHGILPAGQEKLVIENL